MLFIFIKIYSLTGGLDEKIKKVLDLANEQGVPVVFGLNGYKLGHLCHKKGIISCLGIVNYQGAQDIFNELMELIPDAKKKYEELVNRGAVKRPSDDDEQPEEG